MKDLQLFVPLLFCFVLLLNPAHTQELDSLRAVPSVRLNGSLTIGSFFYTTTRENSALQPVGYSLNANANLQLYGVYIPFSVSLNQQGSSFRTPFNRFGLSPTYKSATLHLGHRNLHWSPFLMNGVTIFGAGLEWNPRPMRLGVVYGNLDNTPRFIGNGIPLPSFQRRFRAYKLGFGSDKNYVDFMIIKGKDNLNSLTVEPDSIRNQLVAQENFGIGMSSQFHFFKDRLLLTTDIAASIFTEDLRFDTINFDTLKLASWASQYLIPFNASSHATYAGETSLQWRAGNFLLTGIYRRVMPEFKSFGANYLLTDVEALTVNPNITLMKGQLMLGGSVGLQYNNLDNRLLAKTRRNIGSVDVNIVPANHWGVFLQYSNYSLDQQVFLDSLRQDSLLINQINHNFTVAPRYSIQQEQASHHFFGNINYQRFDDQNITMEQLGDNTLLLANVNYLIHLKGFDLSFNAGINFLKFSSEALDNRQAGVQLGIQKKVWRQKVNLRFNSQFNRTMTANFVGNNWLLRCGANYTINKSSSLSMQYYWQTNNNQNFGFTDTRGQLSWRWRW